MSLLIDHISKKYGETVALSDFSMEIKNGEFVCILGPSGCGKTTLLRLVGGFVEPSAGSIKFGETLYSSTDYSLPVEKRNLGMAFQSFALWPNMTVREHVAFPLRSRRHAHVDLEGKKQLVEHTLLSIGLGELADRFPEELSGGQKQRVALARAIVSKPQMLLMDEPLSALDAELKINMRKEIQDIHRMTKATVLYVTHDQSEALAMADRIVIMRNGLVEQIGTPQEIYLHPQTPFVSTFVGKYNLVKGSWKGDTFQAVGGGALFKNSEIHSCFLQLGIYPIRPEQFSLSKEGEGIPGRIANKQYCGREIHYSVDCGGELIMVYAPMQENYSLDDKVILLKKEELH